MTDRLAVTTNMLHAHVLLASFCWTPPAADSTPAAGHMSWFEAQSPQGLRRPAAAAQEDADVLLGTCSTGCATE